MPTLKENIIEILVKNKNITKDALDKALETQKQKQLPLRKVLVDQKIISEGELLSLLSSQLYLPTLHINKYKFDLDIVNLIPERTARLYNVIALSRMGDTLTVAMSDPLNIFAIDDLRIITNCNIDTVLCPQDEISKAISGQYHSGQVDIEGILGEVSEDASRADAKQTVILRQEEINLSSAIKDSQKSPIIKFVESVLIQALKKRASDIHIEPEEDILRIRYRIDGVLHDVFKVPKINQNAIIARIKIISNLDITENRLPQDGRFKVKFESRQIDFRVSALPITFGQKFVLRLLDKENLSIGLEKLGFSDMPLKVFKEAVSRPFGMILVTGPTGSGKSTTLYSVLNQLNIPERNIVTVEDPVEYQIEGITQLQVKPEIGLDFAAGLRSILRQSPDVIMLGEIRDSETADISIKAALTGQLVLSTLHTNDAISSITRLIDMGVEPFLVASSLIMLCAQRLCRKICPKCKTQVDVPQEYLDKIGFKGESRFFTATGCAYCNHTGFYGRIAVLEAIIVDDVMREMIIKKESLDKIRQYVISERGMITLRDDVFLKVKQELTTLDEALRITTEE